MTFSHFHFLKQHTCAVRAGPAAKPERSEAPSSEILSHALSVCVFRLSTIRLSVSSLGRELAHVATPNSQLPRAPVAPGVPYTA